MKPCPSFVDHGYIELNRAQSLRLLLVESSFLEITSVSVIHTRHMIGSRAAWDEGNRLFSGRHRLLMAMLKCANIADDCVGFAAAGIRRQRPSGAVQCRFVGRRSVFFPAKTSLVGQGITLEDQRGREDGVDF